MFFFPLLPKGRVSRKAAKKLYAQLVQRAREPAFYSELGVPDSFDGRFEMVALHAGMLINRVRADGKAGALLGQSLFDEMFLKMEMSCRQVGIGDLSVPKQIKKMMKAFQGRALVYDQAADLGVNVLSEALIKNLYATVSPPSAPVVAAMAQYMIEFRNSLKKQTVADFLSGQLLLSGLPAKFPEGNKDVQTSQVA